MELINYIDEIKVMVELFGLNDKVNIECCYEEEELKIYEICMKTKTTLHRNIEEKVLGLAFCDNKVKVEFYLNNHYNETSKKIYDELINNYSLKVNKVYKFYKIIEVVFDNIDDLKEMLNQCFWKYIFENYNIKM